MHRYHAYLWVLRSCCLVSLYSQFESERVAGRDQITVVKQTTLTGVPSSYYVSKRQMEEVMHMYGCVPNLETPIGRTKKLRYRVIKYAFTRVRAAYRGHLVTDYRGLHVGWQSLSSANKGIWRFERKVILISS